MVDESIITQGGASSATERAKQESIEAAARGASGIVKTFAAPTAVVGSAANVVAAKAGTYEARAVTARAVEEGRKEHVVQAQTTEAAVEAQRAMEKAHKISRKLGKAEVKSAKQASKDMYQRDRTAEIKLFVESSYGRLRKIDHVFFQVWDEDKRTWVNRTVRDVTDTISQIIAGDALRDETDIDFERLDSFLRSAEGSRFVRNYIAFAVPKLIYQYNNYPNQPFQPAYLTDRKKMTIVFRRDRHKHLTDKLKEKMTQALVPVPTAYHVPAVEAPSSGPVQEGGKRRSRRRTKKSKRKNRRTKRTRKRSRKRTRRSRSRRSRSRRTRRSRSRRTRKRTRRSRSRRSRRTRKKSRRSRIMKGGAAGNTPIMSRVKSTAGDKLELAKSKAEVVKSSAAESFESAKKKLIETFPPSSFGYKVLMGAVKYAKDGKMVVQGVMQRPYNRYLEQMDDNKPYIDLILILHLLHCYPEVKHEGDTVSDKINKVVKAVSEQKKGIALLELALQAQDREYIRHLVMLCTRQTRRNPTEAMNLFDEKVKVYKDAGFPKLYIEGLSTETEQTKLIGWVNNALSELRGTLVKDLEEFRKNTLAYKAASKAGQAASKVGELAYRGVGSAFDAAARVSGGI
jgi:hypothetical protein